MAVIAIIFLGLSLQVNIAAEVDTSHTVLIVCDRSLDLKK